MYIDEAYKAGRKLRKAIKEKGADIFSIVQHIQRTKANKDLLANEYLSLCANYKVEADNFILDMLNEEKEVNWVRINLCLGIMTEGED